MGRGFLVTRGYPTRMGQGFPALAGDGSGMGIRYCTRSGYGAGTVTAMDEIHLPSQNPNPNETYDQIPQPTQPSAHAATQAIGTAAAQAYGGTSTAQVAGAGPSAAQVAGAGPSAAQADAQPVGTAEAQDIGTHRKLTSVVWNHFKREKIDGEWKAICNYCRKKLSGKGSHGTTHLHDHYKACMPRKTKDIRQSILNPRQEKKDGPMSLCAHTFNQTVSRVELAKMIILHEYPLNMTHKNI
ncbi:hypothetical protein LXL04_023706 [Taraxacum kok-saghyz]